MGNVLGDQGKFAEAEEACHEVRRLQPSFAMAHLNLGMTLREQGKLNEADQEEQTLAGSVSRSSRTRLASFEVALFIHYE
ncbi:MAG: tetratricopeptide repeat protein [Pirellulaceae bacterium]